MRGRRKYHEYRQRREAPSKRESMLNMGRMNAFMYDANQIINDMKVPPGVWNSILATIVAKASRQSIEEAQAFISQKVEQGTLPKEVEEPLRHLLGRYSKWR